MSMTNSEAVTYALESIREQKAEDMKKSGSVTSINASTIHVSPIEIVNFLISVGYITKDDVPSNFKMQHAPKTSSVSQGIAFRPRVKVPLLQTVIPGTRKNRKNKRKNSRKNNRRAASRNNRRAASRNNRRAASRNNRRAASRNNRKN